MDIRMYIIYGYDKDLEDLCKKDASGIQHFDTNLGLVRELIYTDAHRKKLNDFDTLAQQMIGQRFGFFCDGGTVLSGSVKSFNWDKDRVTIKFQLKLDAEPDAEIEYSVCIHSGLFVNGDTVVITDEATPLPLNPTEGIPANSFKVVL